MFHSKLGYFNTSVALTDGFLLYAGHFISKYNRDLFSAFEIYLLQGKAVDGLFSMLGEEEKKIRTDPAARGTELLKKVFGR